MFKKIIAFLISFVFLFEQIGFAQVANVIDLSGSFSSVSSINKFRPLHLRSLVYDRIKDDFTLLLDKGDNKNVKPAQLKGSIAKLMEYFQIGVTLPNNTFWVNLRPDGKSDIIDPALENTDIGKILLEADLQLKKDMAMATSPKTREGKIYWKRLYEKAESLLGNQKINIPTLTRPWIVPGEIIVKQSADSAYVYKATLKVMLEQDHLKNSATYGFDDPRLKELNEYSSGLIREAILPKLTKKINSAKEYAPLRQVYYSIVLAQWFKKNAINMPAEYSRRINKEDLAGLSSRSAWSKDNYFNAYRKSFVDGEYNTRETVNSLNGITVRRYFSGGIMLIPDTVTEIAVIPQKTSIVPADVLAVEGKNYQPVHKDQQTRDGGVFAPKRSRTDELSSAIQEINWMRSADRDFVDRRLARIKTLIQDNKYTQNEINTALAAINTKDLDDWFFARKANTALMLGAFAIVGGLTLGALLITGPVFLPMIMGSAVTALLGIAGGYSFYKLIARDIPVRDLTSEYYSEVGKILGNSHRDGGSAQGAGILSLERKGKLLRKLGGLALLERIDDFDAAISGYTWENHLDSIQAEFESSFNNRAEFDEFKAFVKEQSSKEYPTRKLMGAGLGSGLIGIAVSMFMPLPVKILVICVSVGLSLGAIGYFLHKGALPWLDRVMGDFSLRDLKFGVPVEPGTPDGGAADNGLLRENKYDPANIFIRTFVSLWKSTVIPWQANKYIKEISDPRTMRRNKEDAARILGKLGDAKAIPYLREYLVWTVLGDNYDIYPAAEMSLKQLGLNNRDIERIYIAAFKDTGNNRLIRLNAVKVLGERTGERRTLEAFASQPEGNDILMKRAIEEASAKINQRLDKGGVSANFDGGKADELISQAKSIINGQIKNPGQAPGLFRITPEKPLVITTPDETITVTYEGLQEIKKKLSSVLKEYDVRGNDEYFTPEMLVLLGIALGTSKFDSHHGTEGLKPGDTFIIAGDNGPTTPKMRKYLALGLRAAGINVIDLDTCISGQLYTTVSRLGVQGGFYVTRSHVEVGINGFKPIIGKTTLFGDMIQVLGKQIAGDSADSGLRVMDAKDMGAFINTQELQGKITDIYKEKLNVEFTALINKLKDMDIKIAVDFGGGSATSYVDYVKGTLGSKLVNVFRAQSDPTCTKGLPDPSRDDDKCLGHPKSAGDESILSWSARNPDVVVFSFDLDTDRCGIVIAGKLYKGDILFYPVIEYALGKYGQDHKKIYYDSRMIPSIAELVDYLGGTAIIHTKGHSKEKKTVEILMTKLAKEKGFASVEDFVKATGYKNYQMEYSLHPFITIDTGACIDDAMRFMYSWLEAFTAIREKHQQPKWLLDDYLKDLRQKGAFSQWYSLSEQRTSMQEQYKKHLMNEWRDVVTKAFSGDKDFEYVNWEKFEGQKETFTLVDIEGVYYFMTPLGIFYWGWSNTSEKIAFGAHSRSREDLRVLTEVMLSMFLKLRNEKPGLNPKSIRIEAQETKALSDLFSGAGIEDIEKNAAEKFAATEDAVKYLKTAVPETRDGGSTRAALRVIVDRYKGLPPEIEMFLTDAEINAVLAGFKSKDPAVKALLARIGDRPFTKDTNDRFFARVEPQLKEDLAYIRRNAPVIRDGGEAYGFEVNKLLDQLKANDFTSQLEGAANGASYEAVKKIGNGKLSELGFELLKGEWVNRLGWTITNLKAIRDGSAGRTLEDVINDGKELKEKYKYVIFCGMGGSGLSVQFVKDTFKNEAAENIYSLRTTDPTVITLMLKEIAEKEGSLKAALDKTAIVLISKSATTPETVAHRKYFEDVYNTLGLDTQKNLWFITDTISPWGVEAQENPAMRQREIQLNGRGDVGGRFTAPGTNVFLLPMAVVAPELIVPIIDNAIEMNSIKDDPFLRLGAFMLHMAKDLNKDKLTIIVPAALKSYPMWAEQLIEESLGKFGKGITLFYDEENLDVSVLNPVDSNDRVFLRINLGIRKPQANLWKYLEDNGYPTYEISLNDLEDIGGLMLGMQRAVAAFGYLWDICFVNQPAVEGYKIASKLMDKEIISAGGNVKKVLNNIYQASSKKGVLTLYYDPLIQMGAVNINDINDQVRAFGSTMEDPAAVYAAIILLLKHKIEAGEFTSYGNMTDNLKEIFEKVRAEVFTRGLKMPAKLGVGPDKNHAYQQNIEDGKNMFFSTYFLPLQAIQPTEFGLLKDIRGFSDSMIKAQTLGTVQSMIKNKRKVVLLTSDLTAQASETEMAGFFTAVVGYLAKTDASFAEKNIRDGGSITDIAYLHNQLKDTNSANRGSAARDLAQRKDKRSVAPLIAALKTETMPNNRYAICRALVAIGTAAFTPLMFVTTDQTIKAAIREEALTALMDIAKQKKDGGSAELQELYAKAALYSPEIKPLLDILTDDTVSFEAQLKAARLLIALPAGKDFILKNKEVLYRESGVMMVLLNGPLSDGGTGIYSTQGLKNNLKNIGSYDYKKARDLAMILAKRIGRGELSAYFVGRLTVIGDVSVDGPITIGYKETPSDTITILSIPSVEQSEKSVLVNHVFPIQIKINELNNDIVVVGIDKQVVVPSGLPVSNTDGGSKMPTGERFNAWDTEGKVKRDSNDKHTGDVREYKSSPSGETNNGDNVFDGGDKTQAPLGGIDFRGMPIVSQPAIGGVRIPVMPNLTGAVALEELDKQWMEIRASMVQGPMPYLKIQEYVACCNARPDSSKQIQAVTNCVADILKAEEEDALPTCGQLKEILIQLG
ncbi:MAG: HEAT repeat domain-containing protein [Candidatus Omnitrophica bacterium]|nr:HEAT repeat domain-containing protein [Candidatus Omnitrophota bacterium]